MGTINRFLIILKWFMIIIVSAFILTLIITSFVFWENPMVYITHLKEGLGDSNPITIRIGILAIPIIALLFSLCGAEGDFIEKK